MNQMRVMLREARREDVPRFFEHQTDPEGMRMVGSVRTNHLDRDEFMARWDGILANDKIIKRSIVLRPVVSGRGAGEDGAEVVVGSINCFERLPDPARPCTIFPGPEIGYWLGREHRGKGIASQAVMLFLADVTRRPLYARAASDNVASIRVLQNAGFREIGREMFFANMRGQEIEETLMVVGEEQ
ncbi:MAG: GNAT family N-acetyltransferase [Phycisphaeraceae bacterium]|nr:GNAT family N-acetyltransferase [Phycisphaeraceae bacterium]